MSQAAGPGRLRARLVRLLQVLASVAVLLALWRDADLEVLQARILGGSLLWLAAAMALKLASLALHELRLWLALPPPRPPVLTVIALGFVAGVLNLALPARAGDFVAIALLWRECGVPPGRATAVVGMVAFLELATFGALVVFILLMGADQWILILGEAAHSRAVGLMSVGTVGAVGLAVLVVLLARMLGRRPAPTGPHPLTILREALASAGDSLSSARWMGIQVGASTLQVILMIASFSCLFPALGIQVSLPWLAASGILALSSVASVVLPPGFGAGPAAASVAVLAVFGLDSASALAYAAGYWFVANIPAVLTGLPALWGRRGELGRSLADPGIDQAT